jgi:hypothetical protein
MKLGIVSDTHGLVRPALMGAFDGVDKILHAGDVGDDEVLAILETLAPVAMSMGLIYQIRSSLNWQGFVSPSRMGICLNPKTGIET